MFKKIKLSEKVAIVTGASAGIGAAVVRALAAEGANVLLTARRAERLNALVTELTMLPGRRVALAGDIRDAAFCQQLIEAAASEFGRIDILINNAGLGHRSPLSQTPVEHMQTIVDTNLLAVMQTCQAAIPYMRKQGEGHIVNVSSIVGQRPLPNSGFYCASKSALNFLSRSLRMELSAENITVSLLYPGLTATEFQDAVLGGGRKQRWRGVRPERVAKVTLRGLKKRQQEIYITQIDRVFTHFNRLFPHLTDQLVTIFWRG